jgi:ABC-type anion transport system duplicated permease subunit
MEVVGWIGGALILAGYFLLSAGKLDAKSPTYQWLNVVGAIGFIANSSWNGAWPSAALNVIWVGIGVVALAKIFSRREKVA